MLSLKINKKKKLNGIELYWDQDQLDMEHIPFPFRGTIMKLILPPQSSYSKRQHFNFLPFIDRVWFQFSMGFDVQSAQQVFYFITKKVLKCSKILVYMVRRCPGSGNEIIDHFWGRRSIIKVMRLLHMCHIHGAMPPHLLWWHCSASAKIDN